MSNIALVPARCGSKSIPFKNIKDFCGKPLIYWVLNSLNNVKEIDAIYVATDCDEISEIVRSFNFKKIHIYDRDSLNAKDNSTTESLMLEFLGKNNFNDNINLILAQLTSPFTASEDFKNGIDMMEQYDSVMSCVDFKRFIWNKDGSSVNYDYMNRQRRQDVGSQFLENGAFYINSISNIIKHENRLSGSIGLCEMPDYTSVEIDEINDFHVAESIMRKIHLKNNIDLFKTDIKLFVSDIDGVLTDGCKYYNENLEESIKFSTHDGYAFKLLKDQGLLTGIVTSETKKIKSIRFEKLKSLNTLDYFYQGVHDKLSVVKDLCSELNIDISNVAYIGDDVNCFKLLENVGLAACPSDAVDDIKNIKNIIILNKKGGEGVFREFVDLFINNLK